MGKYKKMSCDKTADELAKGFKNYECEGQMSMFDVDWDSLNNKVPVSVKDDPDYESCM